VFNSIATSIMTPEKLNKIIGIVRSLKEENAIGPTNSLSGGKIAGTVESGDSPPIDLRKKSTKKWNPFFKQIAKIQRRKS